MLMYTEFNILVVHLQCTYFYPLMQCSTSNTATPTMIHPMLLPPAPAVGVAEKGRKKSLSEKGAFGILLQAVLNAEGLGLITI